MNKLHKQYIRNIKSLFPLIGKSERKYIKQLSLDVEDCCGEDDIKTLDDLYERFGAPNEVISNYYSNTDINYIVKQINISKWIKRGIVTLLILALASATIYFGFLYSEYKVFWDQQVFFEETVIE